jgi:hypothetical protein
MTIAPLRPLLALTLLLATAGGALAQGQDAAPFDISGTGKTPAATPAAPPEPEPAAPAAAAEPATPAAGAINRYIVPFRAMRMEGETDARSWVIHVSKDELASPATLMVRYLNSVVVMPEASRLRVIINGTKVLEQPIAASNEPGSATAPIPQGVLQAGPNTIRFEAAMYHRTDCSVQSTYELWTDVVPEGTGLSFANAPGKVIDGLDDLAAVGFDGEGVTSVRILVPAGNQNQITPRLMRLTQAVALRGRYAHAVMKVFDNPADVPPAGPGSLTLVLGPAAELPRLLSAPPAEAALRPSVTFLQDARLGGAVVAVSGPAWADVSTAVETFVAGVDRPATVARTSLDTTGWMAPEVPFFTGARSVRLADAGVPTQEFGGRVFRTRFAVGVPADFYANAYGSATLYLDAAYGTNVLPASHFDVYVNGNLASTLTLTNDEGRIYRHYPMELPMRHFRPGVNLITAEVVLNTAEDAACAPGATIPRASRFVLLDSTEISLPNFARIARRPDLSALSGTGFPYNRAEQPASLILGRTDTGTYSAAATLMARIAQVSGRPVAIETNSSPGAAAGRNAIFVGAIGQMPPGLLGQVGLAEDIATSWRTTDVQQAPAAATDPYANALDSYERSLQSREETVKTDQPAATDTDAVFTRWRDDLAGGGGIRGTWISFRQWLERTFEINDQSLGIAASKEPVYTPPQLASFLAAQGKSPLEHGTWTLFAAPNVDALVTGAAEITAPPVWNQVTGRISTFEVLTARVRAQPARIFDFVPTQPFSASNARLIAANWLSGNTIYYASGLLVLCTLLGAYTFSFLGRLGRQS